MLFLLSMVLLFLFAQSKWEGAEAPSHSANLQQLAQPPATVAD